MNTSVVENNNSFAKKVRITQDTLHVDLIDGRTIAVPLAWFPRLFHATLKERNDWRLIGRGTGIHWEEIDEDISVDGLLRGQRSGESQASFAKWLAARPHKSNTNLKRRNVTKGIS